MNRPPLVHPETLLKEVSGEMGVIGFLFIAIGLVLLMIGLSGGVTLAAELLLIATTLVFVGPGVWYFLASRQLARARLWVVPICLKVAAVQGCVIVVLLSIALLVGRIDRSYTFVIPGGCALYFVPALAVLCVRLVKLRRLEPGLSADGHAFEPVRVQPIAPPDQSK